MEIKEKFFVYSVADEEKTIGKCTYVGTEDEAKTLFNTLVKSNKFKYLDYGFEDDHGARVIGSYNMHKNYKERNRKAPKLHEFD